MVGKPRGAVLGGGDGDDLPRWGDPDFRFCPAPAALRSRACPEHRRPVAVKMPESPPFLGIPILLEVGPFIGVRGPLAATIAYC